MKIIFALLILLTAHASARCGETFIGPTSETNRLIINEGELAVFSIFQRTSNRDFKSSPFIIRAGVSNEIIALDSRPIDRPALAGPMELTWEADFVASFQRVQNTDTRTIFPGEDTNSFEIPIGWHVYIFNALPHDIGDGTPIAYALVESSLQTGVIHLFGGEEFYGPNRMSFRPSGGGRNRPLTYSISSSPAQSAPASFSGHLNFTVEKSPDLKTWQPAFLFQASEISPQFFRLSVVK